MDALCPRQYRRYHKLTSPFAAVWLSHEHLFWCGLAHTTAGIRLVIMAEALTSPDGIKPKDLFSGDTCTKTTGPTCDFVYTGYRVPLIVISPFAKKNYVSHTVADYTAWLKLVETRFKLPSLNQRDAAQMDMTEFFDFQNAPWKTPPATPVQPTSGPCYMNQLP